MKIRQNNLIKVSSTITQHTISSKSLARFINDWEIFFWPTSQTNTRECAENLYKIVVMIFKRYKQQNKACNHKIES